MPLNSFFPTRKRILNFTFLLTLCALTAYFIPSRYQLTNLAKPAVLPTVIDNAPTKDKDQPTPTLSAVLGEQNSNQNQSQTDQTQQFIEIKGNLGTLGHLIQKDGKFYLAKNIITNENIQWHTIRDNDLANNSVTSRIIKDHTIQSDDLDSNLTMRDLTVDGKLSLDKIDLGHNTITDGKMTGNWSIIGSLKLASLAGSGNRCVYADSNGNLQVKTEDCDSNGGSDNLGNHILTQNLITGNHWISGDGDNEGIFIDAQGNVGIGTTGPGYKLDISGDINITNSWLTLPNPDEDGNVNQFKNYLTIAPTTNYTNNYAFVQGFNNVVSISESTPATDLSGFYPFGASFYLNYNAHAPVTQLIGIEGGVVATTDSPIDLVQGGSLGADNFGSGNISSDYGLVSTVGNYGGGSITEGSAIAAGIFNIDGTIANAYGLNIHYFYNNGTITNTYGVYVGDITVGTQTNVPFSFYASDVNAKNYFAGNVGIGTTDPSQKLNIQGVVNPSAYPDGDYYDNTPLLVANNLTISGSTNINSIWKYQSAISNNLIIDSGTSSDWSGLSLRGSQIRVINNSQGALSELSAQSIVANHNSNASLDNLVGVGSDVYSSGSGAVGHIYGVSSWVGVQPASAVTASADFLAAGYFLSQPDAIDGSTINIDTSYGVLGMADTWGSGGTINIARQYGVFAEARASLDSGTVNVNNSYGIFVRRPTSSAGGHIANAYGLYIEGTAQGEVLDYSLYSAGGKNFFAGNIGIGTTNPGAKLEINSGSAGVTGMKLTQVTSGSSAGAGNGKVLGLDANGNIILVTDQVGSGTSLPTGTLAGQTLYYNGSNWVTNINLFNNAGNIGIGTTNPLAKLSVQGTAVVTGHSALGNSAVIDKYGSTIVDIGEQDTSQSFTGLYTNISYNPSFSDSENQAYGVKSWVSTPSSNNKNIGYILGGSFGADYIGSGNVGELTGSEGYVYNEGSGVVSNMNGFNAYWMLNGTAKTTNASGVTVQWQGAYDNSQVTNGYGVWVDSGYKDVGATLTNLYGIRIESQIAGTNNWNFYSAGAGTRNFFEGNVGIGTTNPNYKVDVNGTIHIGPAESTLTELLGGYPSYTNADNLITNNSSNNPYGTALGIEAQNAWGGLYVGVTGGDNNNSVGIESDGIVNRNGNDTTGIIGWAGTYDNVSAGSVTGGNFTVGTYFSGSSIVNAYSIKIQSSYGLITNNYGLYIEDQSGIGLVNSFNLYSAGANSKNYFAGNVGIGTTAPTQKLTVAGNINVVGGSFIDDGTTLTVPDYVFEPGYNLKSLPDLETYINQNLHLPNVPSQGQIKQNGMNYGSMIMSLLEKTEENTLYTIDNYHQITQLDSRLNSNNLSTDDKMNIISQNLTDLNLKTQDLASLQDQIKNQTKDLTELQSQMIDIQLQNKAFNEFLVAFDVKNIDNFAKLKAPINTFTGQLEAAGIVAGAFSVKTVDETKKTLGDATICEEGKVWKDTTCTDPVDGETPSDGKTIEIRTGAVSGNSKIYVTPVGSTGNQVLYVGKIEVGTSFEVRVDDSVKSEIKFNWWMVEDK